MDQLYKEELMEIFKNPKQKGMLEDANVSGTGNNPFCGDKIKLELKITNGIIEKARFDGSACAVSVISSEKLLSFVEGKSVGEVSKLTQEDLLKILDINVSMTRIKCATLVLSALREALEKYHENN